VGDHVLVRRMETEGFCHPAVVTALSVDGAPKSNKNLLVMFTSNAATPGSGGGGGGGRGAVLGFPEQCAPEDVLPAPLRPDCLRGIASAVLRWLRRASQLATVPIFPSGSGRSSSSSSGGGGGGCSSRGSSGSGNSGGNRSNNDSSSSSQPEQEQSLMLWLAKQTVEDHVDVLDIADVAWFVAELQRCLPRQWEQCEGAGLERALHARRQAAAAAAAAALAAVSSSDAVFERTETTNNSPTQEHEDPYPFTLASSYRAHRQLLQQQQQQQLRPRLYTQSSIDVFDEDDMEFLLEMS
jgi:hypothetical protein